MNARKVFIETFPNYDEAEAWMGQHLDDHEDWIIIQADLKHINGSWRSGIIFEQGQLSFDLDHQVDLRGHKEDYGI